MANLEHILCIEIPLYSAPVPLLLYHLTTMRHIQRESVFIVGIHDVNNLVKIFPFAFLLGILKTH